MKRHGWQSCCRSYCACGSCRQPRILLLVQTYRRLASGGRTSQAAGGVPSLECAGQGSAGAPELPAGLAPGPHRTVSVEDMYRGCPEASLPRQWTTWPAEEPTDPHKLRIWHFVWRRYVNHKRKVVQTDWTEPQGHGSPGHLVTWSPSGSPGSVSGSVSGLSSRSPSGQCLCLLPHCARRNWNSHPTKFKATVKQC